MTMTNLSPVIRLRSGSENPFVLVDPIRLSLRELRSILNARGIDYNLAVEKTDLSHLVKVSGSVRQHEVKCAETLANYETPDETQFYEIKTFTKSIDDSEEIWLIQIEGESAPILSSFEWVKLKQRLRLIGVHCGKVVCKESPDLCSENGFLSSQILISYQCENRGHKVQKKQYLSQRLSSGSGGVFAWVSRALQDCVQSADASWLSRAARTRHPVQLVYSSPHAPLPLALVAAKVRSGPHVRLGKIAPAAAVAFDGYLPGGEQARCAPRVFAITSDAVRTYGCDAGEYLFFPHVTSYLQLAAFDVNALFTASIVACQLLATLSFLTTPGGVLLRAVGAVKSLLVYNVALLMTWLIVSSSSVQSDRFQPLLDATLSAIRDAAGGSIATQLRGAVLRSRYTAHALALGFVIYFAAAVELLKRARLIALDDDEDADSSISELLLSNRDAGGGEESDVQRWVERLATPALWLQPLVPTDYVDELPVWPYSGECLSSDSDDAQRRVTTHVGRRSVGYGDRGRQCGSERGWSSVSQQLLRSIRDTLRRRSPHGGGGRRTGGPPCGMRDNRTCTICLEHFRRAASVCGLPCGHVFHQACIFSWLLYNDGHRCPVCRWPAYQRKSPASAAASYG